MIHTVLNHPLLRDKPPVLVDIGASTRPPRAWRQIAQHAVCLAFDADDRETSYLDAMRKHYKQLHIIRAIVTSEAQEQLPFYLTRFPECSSTLQPDHASLKNWAFSDSFDVIDTVNLKTCRLDQTCSSLKIGYIDWLKTDTQGTDLRLLNSLSLPLRESLLMVEMEPGLIDAYVGEDKLTDVLSQLTGMGFWLTDMHVKGSQWLAPEERRLLSRYARYCLKRSPGWTELRYLHNMENRHADLRACLLQWLFATTVGQHGFAACLARTAQQYHHDTILQKLYNHAICKIRRQSWQLPIKVMRHYLGV